jgi:hypothetical protein
MDGFLVLNGYGMKMLQCLRIEVPLNLATIPVHGES